jgi:hypothetical protein
MGRLPTNSVNIRGIVAETGPIGVGTQPITPTIPSSMSLMALKHKNFIDQVIALNRGFTRQDIVGFTPEELEEHVQIALQDNYITEDGKGTGQFVSGQVAWRLKELTKGYVYERL